MQLTINIPFRPAYVSDSGIQPPVPQTVVTLDVEHGPQYMPLPDSYAAAYEVHWQHPLSARVHRIADDHRIQRIVGIPLSFVERAPRAQRVSAPRFKPALHFADVAWEDEAADERTPLDLPVPEGISHDDHVMPTKPSDYDGFDSRDTLAPRLPVGRHSRPVAHDPADLERMADQILAAADAGQLRIPKPLRVPGLIDTTKPWPVDQRTSPSDWEYKRFTYTLGHKPCPRCHGNVRPFAQRPCRYCRQQGGWAITRTRMTPFHPQHGFALTPPRLDGAPVHTSHWRTRGEYYGDVRVRSGRPSEAIMDEIRRRHFANVTRRQLRALAVKEERHLIAA